MSQHLYGGAGTAVATFLTGYKLSDVFLASLGKASSAKGNLVSWQQAGFEMNMPPLNSINSFAIWSHFDPGIFIDMNPSFVRLSSGEGWSLFCRYKAPPMPGEGSIWAVRVNESMEPCGAPILLIDSGIDPRVIAIGTRVFVFFAKIDKSEDGKIEGSTVAYTEFSVESKSWRNRSSYALPKNPVVNNASIDSVAAWEKNWVPFKIKGHLIGLIYSHEPWHVIILNVEEGTAPKLDGVYSSPSITWDYGTIRGGTPPLRYDDGHMITFYHSSSTIAGRRVYSVGACVFDDQAPYSPAFITSSPLMVAPYKTGVHRFGWHHAASVIFPLGADEIASGYRLICGLDDGEIASFDVPKDEITTRLTKPVPETIGAFHDYRDRGGVRSALKGVLFVPDPIPGIPELSMVQFLKVIAGQGRTFVDIGAHIGFYSIGLAAGFDRVLSFEPSNFQNKWLNKNKLLNDYEHMVCKKVALGEQAGFATLNVLSHEGGLNTIVPDVAAVHAQKYHILDQYTVPVEVLDDLGVIDADLIKIDVEGHELSVLRGAVKTINAGRPVILIEVWTEEVRRAEIKNILETLNYTFEPMFPNSPELALCIPLERRETFSWFI
ncbi:FkbM family methyltransferase [Beijerinckia sp. L45]|uniref:FkbM family methyltransferase n=1 Tax=Beijerinckia sp. L45 TaxID=1641855 RepID=UPI00131D68BE|nr:FkbM family methyltransferase [Beijerinckia sp. L45]